MYVLAIDGGGTKTKGVIADSDGVVIAQAIVGGSNPNGISLDLVKMELTNLIDSLKMQAGDKFLQVTRVFAGMSGVEEPKTKQKMHQLLESMVENNVSVSVDNDAITALYSGTFGKPGIVQIAGTGAITYGFNQYGERGRVGGWGYLFSDQGSGYQLGRDGLEAAFQAYDGIGNQTSIQTLLLEHFNVKDLPAIVRMVYQGDNPKEIIASLSRLVVRAADDGDDQAQRIIQQNGERLGKSIAYLVDRLFTLDENSVAVPVVLTGGLFNRLDLFEQQIKQKLDQCAINTRLIIPQLEPVGGAVIAALKQEKVFINESEFTIQFTKSEV